MIQAGTINTGSAPTVAVVGAYWINSISALRKTTLPGVAARSLPTMKRLAGRRRLSRPGRAASFAFRPSDWRRPLARVASITSGLSQGTLDGDIRSSHCRTVKATMRAFGWPTPRRTLHDTVPPFLAKQHRLREQIEGVAAATPAPANRWSSGFGVIAASPPIAVRASRDHCVECSACQRRRLERRVARVGGPIEQRKADRAGRSPAGVPALPDVQHPIETFRRANGRFPGRREIGIS